MTEEILHPEVVKALDRLSKRTHAYLHTIGTKFKIGKSEGRDLGTF